MPGNCRLRQRNDHSLPASAMIYLDHNATAPLGAPARAAMGAAMRIVGNPSSVHAAGREARALIETARAEVAALVGARPEQVVFTSGGTEANTLALTGMRAAMSGCRVMVSAVEHVSVLAAVSDATVLPVIGDGILDTAALDRSLQDGAAPTVVSVMLANNETGAIQPIAEIARMVRGHGALLHTDAVQAAGRLRLDFAALGVDLLTVSAHKLGGPAGIGALVVRDPGRLAPLLRGGGQERRLRAGTENLIGIAGFGAAARDALDRLSSVPALAAMRDRMEAQALAAVPDAVVIGGGSPRVANTSCLALPGVRAETQVMALDLEGIAVSAGAACSSGKVARSHVLAAMGVADELADTAIRVSLGHASSADEVDRFVEAWARLAVRARANAA